MVLVGALLLPPAEGAQGVSTTTMQLDLEVASDGRCALGPVRLNLVSTTMSSGRMLSTAADGFLIPQATGDPECEAINDLLGLPTTDTVLQMDYLSPHRPGPVDVRYVSSGGRLVVGGEVELALPADNGELVGTRNPVTGVLAANLAIAPFTADIDVAGVGPVPVAVSVSTEPVEGRVPPGPGLAALLAGLALVAHTLWTAPRFTATRQRLPGARWQGQRPHSTPLTVGAPMVAAMAIGLWAIL